MQIYNPTIKCNFAYVLVFWTREQRVTGSNPSRDSPLKSHGAASLHILTYLITYLLTYLLIIRDHTEVSNPKIKIYKSIILLLILYECKTLSLAVGEECTRIYPKVSGLVAWSENCKWYSSLPLGAVVSLFRESV
jgi:hypothetical protein